MPKAFGLLVVVFVVTGVSLGQTVPAPKRQPKNEAREGVAPFQGEILQRNAAWCAPRILYFFSCYYGLDHSLQEIVNFCHTDYHGFTSLLDLFNAARELGLEPIAVSCQASQLEALGGPAILCIRVGPTGSKQPGNSKDLPSAEPVHFIGLIGVQDGQLVVIDPSSATEELFLNPESLEHIFTGEAILLKGSTKPLLRSGWLDFPQVLFPATLVALLTFGLGGWVGRFLGQKKPASQVKICFPPISAKS